jgi:hypothetical protein
MCDRPSNHEPAGQAVGCGTASWLDLLVLAPCCLFVPEQGKQQQNSQRCRWLIRPTSCIHCLRGWLTCLYQMLSCPHTNQGPYLLASFTSTALDPVAASPGRRLRGRRRMSRSLDACKLRAAMFCLCQYLGTLLVGTAILQHQATLRDGTRQAKAADLSEHEAGQL